MGDALDSARQRRAANSRASQYREFAYLPDLIGERLLERLAVVRLAPQRVLSLGSALSPVGAALAARFGKAQVIEFDAAVARAALARRDLPRWRNRRLPGAAESSALPLPDASVELALSVLGLPDPRHPAAACREMARVLRHGGVAMVATLGPGSFAELRESFGAAAMQPMHDFADMHHLGDEMLAAGLCDVVVESESLAVTYADLPAMLRELRGLGAINARTDRGRSLTGKRRWQAVQAAAEQQREDGRQPLTVEVVYAHAWRLERPRPERGSGSVDVGLPLQ